MAARFLYSALRHYGWHWLKGKGARKKPSAKQGEGMLSQFRGSRLPKHAPRITNMFAEKNLLELHKTLAEGLVPQEDGGAGAYRRIRVTTGPDGNYPTPSLVPDCMKRFAAKAHKCIMGPGNLFQKAAMISGEFVLIHPFADFNGRVSRLLMNAVLLPFGIRFPVAIRATKKSKKRYFQALEHGRAGHWHALASLIAMEFTDRIQVLNTILRKAGRKQIRQAKLPTALARALDEEATY